jgi:ubiquinone biosynthesis protein Coq4
MNFDAPSPHLVPFGLRAAKTVATARAAMHPTQRTMIDLAQRLILHTDVDVDALTPITPAELAAVIPSQQGAERVIRGMVLTCLARGEVSREDAADIERFARALHVEEHSVDHLRQLAEGHLALLRYDVNRRAFTGQAIAQARQADGILALLKDAAVRIGLRDDQETAARYEALADYPERSLGRELWAYYQRNNFPIPGRKHAIPSFATVHDLCHLLSGYGVDGPGEIEVVAFQAGFMKTDPMSTIFFILLQSHLGVRLVAIAPGNKGALDDPHILERAIRAARRGAAVKRDLFDHWDYWPALRQDIEQVRAELGVPPLDSGEAAANDGGARSLP